MCFEIIAQRFRCGHLIETNSGRTTHFCLFGEQCKEVKHRHRIFRRAAADEDCPNCARNQEAGDKLWPAAKVPHYVHEKKQCIEGAPARLRTILSGAVTPKDCKDLLHYVLGLPEFMRKVNLVHEFGYGTGGGRFPANWERDMLVIAQKKRLDNALTSGMKKKQGETKK